MSSYEFQGPGARSSQTPQRSPDRAPRERRPRSAGTSFTIVQILSGVVGAAFLLIGILGFIPGPTSGDLNLIGPDSPALLLGLFQVSVVHNIVHLAFGVAGLLAARRMASASGFLIGGGVLYAVVWVYGLLVERGSTLDFLPVNDNDNVLHLGLATGMIVLGVVGTALSRRTAAQI